MIGQKQQDTFKRYDDFIKSIANGRRLAESCGQDTVDTTQTPKAKGPDLSVHTYVVLKYTVPVN